MVILLSIAVLILLAINVVILRKNKIHLRDLEADNKRLQLGYDKAVQDAQYWQTKYLKHMSEEHK